MYINYTGAVSEVNMSSMKSHFTRMMQKVKDSVQRIESKPDIKPMIRYLKNCYYPYESEAKTLSNVFDDVLHLCTFANIYRLEEFLKLYQNRMEVAAADEIVKHIEEYKQYFTCNTEKMLIHQCLDVEFYVDYPPPAHGEHLELELNLNVDTHFLKDIGEIVKIWCDELNAKVHVLLITKKEKGITVECCFPSDVIKDVLSIAQRKLNELKHKKVTLLKIPGYPLLDVACNVRKFYIPKNYIILKETDYQSYIHKDLQACKQRIVSLQEALLLRGRYAFIIYLMYYMYR